MSATLSAGLSPRSQTVYFDPKGCLLPIASLTRSASGGSGTYPFIRDLGGGAWRVMAPTGGSPSQDMHTPPMVADYTVRLNVTESGSTGDEVGSAPNVTVYVTETIFC